MVDSKRRVVAKKKSGARVTADVTIQEVKVEGKFGEESDHFFVGYFQDISGDIMLKNVHMQQEATLKMATTAFISINIQGTVLTFNQGACRLFGYEDDSKVVGHNVSQLMPKPWSSNHDSYLKNYRDTGEAKILGKQQRKLLAKRRDGSTFSAHLLVEKVEPVDEVQDPYFIATIEDITEKMVLVEAKEKHRSSTAMSLRPIVVADASGSIVNANRAAALLFGFQNIQSMVEKSFKVLLQDGDASQHEQHVQQYLKTGQAEALNALRSVAGKHLNGSQLSLRVQVNVVRSDDALQIDVKGEDSSKATGLRFVAVFDDVTTERRTSYRDPLQRALIHMNVLATVLISSGGIIKEFNKAAEHLFEFRASQVIGKNVNILMPESMHAQHDQYLKNYLTTRRKTAVDSSIKVVGETKSGAKLNLELSVRQIVLATDDLEFIGTLRLITK